MIRGTLVGSLCALIPGTGPTIASFVAYATEKKVSKTPHRFGHGAIEVAVRQGLHAQSCYAPGGSGVDSDDGDLGVGERDAGFSGGVDGAAQAQDRVGGGDAAVHSRRVGELGVAGEVAGGPDPGVRRAQMGIDVDVATLIERHSRRLEAECIGPGCATDGDQRTVEFDAATVGEGDGVLADRLRGGSGQHLDSVGAH